MVIFRLASQVRATPARSPAVRGWRTLTPPSSLDAIRQPSVGWASRTYTPTNRTVPSYFFFSASTAGYCRRNGPHEKLPVTSTTGVGPTSLDRVTVPVPSAVGRVKSGAGSSMAGPGDALPISPANSPLSRVSMDGASAELEKLPAFFGSGFFSGALLAGGASVLSASFGAASFLAGSFFSLSFGLGGGSAKSAAVSTPSVSASSAAKLAAGPRNWSRGSLSAGASPWAAASHGQSCRRLAGPNQPSFGPIWEPFRMASNMRANSAGGGSAGGAARASDRSSGVTGWPPGRGRSGRRRWPRPPRWRPGGSHGTAGRPGRGPARPA